MKNYFISKEQFESNNFANFAIDMDSALAQIFSSHDALL